LTASGQLFFPVSIAQETVVANTLESIGQSVQEKASDEFLGGKGHGFLLALVPVIFPLEAYLAIGDIQQAMVRDRHAVGIAANVVKHLLRARKGPLGIDHPLGLSEWRQVGSPFAIIPKPIQGVKELQLARIEGTLEVLQK
jgi:hypothetical protein